MRSSYLHLTRRIAVLLTPRGVKGRNMSDRSKDTGTVKQTEQDQKSGQHTMGPTVTTSGQVMWTTRDLLFPSGHAQRTAPRPAKK